MRILLATAATVLLLVGCAGNSSVAPVDNGAEQSARALSSSSAVRPVVRQLVYVDYFQAGPTTDINIYSELAPIHLVAEIHGGMNLTAPKHLAVDGGGNVYVANSQGPSNTGQGEILVYPPGRTTPIKTLHIGGTKLWFVDGVCVRSGFVYGVIGQGIDGGPWPLYGWAHGSALPTSTIYMYPSDDSPTACAVDSKGNLFVLYTTNGGSTAAIDKFTPGSHTPQTLAISLLNGSDIAVDASDDLLVSGILQGSARAVSVFPPGQIVPSKTFDSGGLPWGFSLDSSGNQLFVVDLCADQGCTKSHVVIYDYGTGKVVGGFPGEGKAPGAQFIAVTPRAPGSR